MFVSKFNQKVRANRDKITKEFLATKADLITEIVAKYNTDLENEVILGDYILTSLTVFKMELPRDKYLGVDGALLMSMHNELQNQLLEHFRDLIPGEHIAIIGDKLVVRVR